jgi:hypothetical protein
MKVFLSHASADKPTVRAIAQALTDSQIEVWLDEADIRVGESIPEAITSGLFGSDLFCSWRFRDKPSNRAGLNESCTLST